MSIDQGRDKIKPSVYGHSFLIQFCMAVRDDVASGEAVVKPIWCSGDSEVKKGIIVNVSYLF